jgi:hypothetical protein
MFDSSVRERDLDHFLLEELSASPAFFDWFMGRLAGCFRVPAHADVRVQRSPRRLTDTRQTDLQIGFADGDEVKGVVLIENKVTDGFQDAQPEAYADEITAWRERVGQKHAVAVLVSPRSNMAVQGCEHFHAAILIEEIVDHLAERLRDGGLPAELRARLEIKVELLEAICGKRANSRWNPETIPERRDFRLMYEALLRDLAPGLRVRPSVDGRKATTRFFDGFPGQGTLPFSAQLKHEYGHGDLWKYAALQFKGAGHLVEAVRAADGLVPPDGSIQVDRSGTSLMIRVVTPGIDPDPARFDEQREKLEAGIDALKLLCEWLQRNKGALAEIMNVVHSSRGTAV